MSKATIERKKTKKKSGGKSVSLATVDFHSGSALKHLSGTYPNLMAVLKDLVQNALDVDVMATRIYIEVDLRPGHRFAVVQDNGKGVSITQFTEDLRTIASPGRKAERSGKRSMGRFALGNVSALWKCEEHTFISCPSPQKSAFTEWRFNGRKIFKCTKGIKIPMIARDDLTLDPDAKSAKVRLVDWNTEIRLEGLVEDRVITRFNLTDFKREIQGDFSSAMRDLDTKITLNFTHEDGTVEAEENITALEYAGNPLTVVVIDDFESVGDVYFRLYVAPKSKKGGGRHGEVRVGETNDAFRFSFKSFARSLGELKGKRGKPLIVDPDIINAVGSGLFEGEITGAKVKLHANRTEFEANDALIGFCAAMELWWKQGGKDHVETAREDRKEERWQEVGRGALDAVEEILKTEKYQYLREGCNNWKLGSIGTRHANTTGIVGKQNENSVTTGSGDGASESDASEASGDETSEAGEPKEREGHMPFSSKGTRGRRRTNVRGHSFGLQVEHGPLEGSSDLWILNEKEGVVVFNSRHPDFVACDEKNDEGAALQQLEEMVLLQVLTLLCMSDSIRQTSQAAFAEYTKAVVPWILIDRKAMKKKKKK